MRYSETLPVEGLLALLGGPDHAAGCRVRQVHPPGASTATSQARRTGSVSTVAEIVSGIVARAVEHSRSGPYSHTR